MNPPNGPDSRLLLVDAALARWPVTDDRARELLASFPDLNERIVGWIWDSWKRRELRRVERLANLAAKLRPTGLDDVLKNVLDAATPGLNEEDLVDILGEIQAVGSEDILLRVVQRSVVTDAPAFWLCQKAIGSLCDLGTDKARDHLMELTSERWPTPVRWHAAVALGIEDDLGFDEQQMVG